jgi:hypothetical protein
LGADPPAGGVNFRIPPPTKILLKTATPIRAKHLQRERQTANLAKWSVLYFKVRL